MRADLLPLALFGCLSLALAGCSRGPNWRDETGSVAPGATADVYARSRSTGGDYADRADQMVVLSRNDQDELDPPELGAPQGIHIWFFPTKTQDGLAWRKGFFVTRVTKTFSFSEEDEMYAATPLLAAGAGDAVNPEQIQAMQAQIQVQQSFVDGIEHRLNDLVIPWSESKPAASKPVQGK